MDDFRKGTKLRDTYFRCNVVVLGSGQWQDPRYIMGRYYKVKYPDGTIMDSHETSFVRPWFRERDKKSHFVNTKAKQLFGGK